MKTLALAISFLAFQSLAQTPERSLVDHYLPIHAALSADNADDARLLAEVALASGVP